MAPLIYPPNGSFPPPTSMLNAFTPVAGRHYFARCGTVGQSGAEIGDNCTLTPVVFNQTINVDALTIKVIQSSLASAGGLGFEYVLFIYDTDPTTSLPKNLLVDTGPLEIQPRDEEFLSDNTTPNPLYNEGSAVLTTTVTPTELEAGKTYWVGIVSRIMGTPDPNDPQTFFDCNTPNGLGPFSDAGLATEDLDNFTAAGALYCGSMLIELLDEGFDFPLQDPLDIPANSFTGVSIRVGVRVEE